MVFQSLLNHPFTIRRIRRTPDGQGGWLIDHVPVGTVQGRLRPASTTEREVAMLEERQITHVFYCMAGEDVERGDTITFEEMTVEMLGTREPSLAREHWEIDCLEIQKEVSAEEGGS